MQALNYIAQAEQSLQFSILSLRHNNKRNHDDFEKYVSALGLLQSAKHFQLPVNGKILNDGWRGLFGNDDIKLPFEKIALQFSLDNHEYMHKIVLLCEQQEEGIMILCLFNGPITGDKYWELMPVLLCLSTKLNEAHKGTFDVARYLNSYDLPDDDLTSIGYNVPVHAVFELVEALSCRNVSVENIQENFKGNAKRISEGKLPFYETKHLVINVADSKGNYTTGNGHHASPRQHLRRGHIRRLPIGNIWVNSCVVGDSSRGIIKKTYEIRGAA